ncbi:MAG: hypothetical protein KBD56_06755 [Candidatus Eisenbacteria bacterium]|nr:hypothetical protein [Candidatus Eisenbacteria bacterium]
MNLATLLAVPALIAGGGASAQPDSLDACGWFGKDLDGCVYFYASLPSGCTYFGTEFAALPDSIEEYRMVRVRGKWMWSEKCGPFGVHDPVISRCEPVDLGCGVLYYDDVDYCSTWDSPTYGSLLISFPQGYATGDTVRAMGIIEECMTTVCMLPGLESTSFSPCEDIPPAVQRDTWGSIKVLFKEP